MERAQPMRIQPEQRRLLPAFAGSAALHALVIGAAFHGFYQAPSFSIDESAQAFSEENPFVLNLTHEPVSPSPLEASTAPPEIEENNEQEPSIKKPDPQSHPPKQSKPKSSARRTRVIQPDYRRNPPPAYPSLARKREWQGTVILKVHINRNGRARSVSIHRSSGHSVLDHSAIRAVRKWRFQPAYAGGVAIESHAYVPIRFALR